ncbi:uncharacterized protein [Lolium perenne]|uniref:uncharacterized protein isoform X2 n=1 Tax=Lolium perenne TaxID=4522 RepID=UPI003A9966B1
MLLNHIILQVLLWAGGNLSLSSIIEPRLGLGLEGAAASGSGAGPPSKVKVVMLELRGEFSNDNQEIWTQEELKRHIVQGLDGQSSDEWELLEQQPFPTTCTDIADHSFATTIFGRQS